MSTNLALTFPSIVPLPRFGVEVVKKGTQWIPGDVVSSAEIPCDKLYHKSSRQQILHFKMGVGRNRGRPVSNKDDLRMLIEGLSK